MKKLTIPMAVAALAAVLAACGGSAKNSSSTASSSASNVLKDTSGMALYTPDGESASSVRCTGACVAIWKPARPGNVKLGGTAKITVFTRPDGTKQAAAAGKPLYTFAQDSPGAVTGNGASDAFGAKKFTWHVVTASGSTSSTSKSTAPAQSSGGYGNNGY